MTAALGTLVFLTALWLLVVVGAAVLEESGAKILAALKGKSAAPQLSLAAVRGRSRARVQQPRRVPAKWRAAA